MPPTSTIISQLSRIDLSRLLTIANNETFRRYWIPGGYGKLTGIIVYLGLPEEKTCKGFVAVKASVVCTDDLLCGETRKSLVGLYSPWPCQDELS